MRKIRRDEALDFAKIANIKDFIFKNKKKYNRKLKHKNENGFL